MNKSNLNHVTGKKIEKSLNVLIKYISGVIFSLKSYSIYSQNEKKVKQNKKGQKIPIKIDLVK